MASKCEQSKLNLTLPICWAGRGDSGRSGKTTYTGGGSGDGTLPTCITVGGGTRTSTGGMTIEPVLTATVVTFGMVMAIGVSVVGGGGVIAAGSLGLLMD